MRVFFCMEVDKFLSKTYKGRFVEHLEQFLLSLDKTYRWVNYHFNFKPTKNKTKYYFCFYCRDTESLILCAVHKVQHTAKNIIKVIYNENAHYALNDRTFIVNAVYSKGVAIKEPDFDTVSEHFEFLFPQTGV